MNKYTIAVAIFAVCMFFSWLFAHQLVQHEEMVGWYFFASATLGIFALLLPFLYLDTKS